MPANPTEAPTLRIGARVLLLDQHDRVLLLHAKDPDVPNNHWWELPGGGADSGEALPDTDRRELAEETSILLDHLGPPSGTARPAFATAVKSTTVARPSTSPASPIRRPPCDLGARPTKQRASSATIGGANPNLPPAQISFCHPTCQPCWPPASQANFSSPSSCRRSSRRRFPLRSVGPRSCSQPQQRRRVVRHSDERSRLPACSYSELSTI